MINKPHGLLKEMLDKRHLYLIFRELYYCVDLNTLKSVSVSSAPRVIIALKTTSSQQTRSRALPQVFACLSHNHITFHCHAGNKILCLAGGNSYIL